MKKILLIEDEKILVEMYNEKFSQAGFDMILSIDAEKGLKLAKKEKPDLIILDILLPEGDGVFFLKEQKKDPEIASIPVVASQTMTILKQKKRSWLWVPRLI